MDLYLLLFGHDREKWEIQSDQVFERNENSVTKKVSKNSVKVKDKMESATR